MRVIEPEVEVASGIRTDISTLRKRARRNIEQGAVTAGYAADRASVLRMLNEALATEVVCVLRYKRHHFLAAGIHSAPVATGFRQHANEEMPHADRIAERIIQLRGQPDFSPDGPAARSHLGHVEGWTLEAMIQANPFAGRIAIGSYRETTSCLADQDPTTRRMLEEILACVEEHADDLSSLLGTLPA